MLLGTRSHLCRACSWSVPSSPVLLAAVAVKQHLHRHAVLGDVLRSQRPHRPAQGVLIVE